MRSESEYVRHGPMSDPRPLAAAPLDGLPTARRRPVRRDPGTAAARLLRRGAVRHAAGGASARPRARPCRSARRLAVGAGARRCAAGGGARTVRARGRHLPGLRPDALRHAAPPGPAGARALRLRRLLRRGPGGPLGVRALDRGEGRWALADPQLDDAHRRHLGSRVRHRRCPRRLLHDHRRGLACMPQRRRPGRFGHGDDAGPWFLEVNLARDLHALAMAEASLWDDWRNAPASWRENGHERPERCDRMALLADTARELAVPASFDEPVRGELVLPGWQLSVCDCRRALGGSGEAAPDAGDLVLQVGASALIVGFEDGASLAELRAAPLQIQGFIRRARCSYVIFQGSLSEDLPHRSNGSCWQ